MTSGWLAALAQRYLPLFASSFWQRLHLPSFAMPYEHILFETEAGVARITLNRPDVLNSVNGGMARELRTAFSEIARDRALRAVLLTGAGRAFCAGQDLAEASPQAGGAL